MRLAALSAASTAIVSALSAFTGESSPSGLLLAAIATPTLLAILFAPLENDPPGRALRNVVAWSAGVLLAAGVCCLLFGVNAPANRIASAMAMAFLILLCVHAAAALLGQWLRRAGIAGPAASEWSTWIGAAILWLSASAPAWLGPLADILAHGNQGAPAAIAAVSPLSHLAVAAGHDLLRNEWFYAHSPIGSLQFDYPAATVLFLSYIAVATLLAVLTFVTRSSGADLAESSRSTITLEHAR